MKKFILILFILSTLSLLSVRADESDIDINVNSLYAANRLDEAFNMLLSIPQEERTAHQWIMMGNIMMDYGKNSDAEFMYNSALTKDPKSYKALYNLGNIYLSDGKPNMAIDKFKQSLKYKKDFAYGYYNLGCAYIKTGELRKAKNALLDAIYFKSTEADFHYNLAYVYKKLNNQKNAQMYLDYYNKIKNNS